VFPGRGLRSLRRGLEWARGGLELALSARRFSLRTGALVQKQLSFIATVVRAGEHGAARRLLEEIEKDLRLEGAALIRTIERLGGPDEASNGSSPGSEPLEAARSVRQSSDEARRLDPHDPGLVDDRSDH